LAWPVNSEKSDGRNVISNAASGLLSTSEIVRAAIECQNAERVNQRQGQRGPKGFRGRILKWLVTGARAFTPLQLRHANAVMEIHRFYHFRRQSGQQHAAILSFQTFNWSLS